MDFFFYTQAAFEYLTMAQWAVMACFTFLLS